MKYIIFLLGLIIWGVFSLLFIISVLGIIMLFDDDWLNIPNRLFNILKK